MATTGTLRKNAQEKFGEDPETLIPRLLKQYKTVAKVAAQLDVYPNTIQKWLDRNGYRKQTRVIWAKKPNGRTTQQ